LHVVDERKRPGSRRQKEIARKLDSIMGGIDDIVAVFGAGFGSRSIGVGLGRSPAWLECSAQIPVA
jgi:hypothetical protein